MARSTIEPLKLATRFFFHHFIELCISGLNVRFSWTFVVYFYYSTFNKMIKSRIASFEGGHCRNMTSIFKMITDLITFLQFLRNGYPCFSIFYVRSFSKKINLRLSTYASLTYFAYSSYFTLQNYDDLFLWIIHRQLLL